jgi:diadenosine tetraphosphate (Ap4A) HIT family hydrolase
MSSSEPSDRSSNNQSDFDATCPFCNLNPSGLVAESDSVVAFLDKFPVSEGHTLIVPRRHVSDATALSDVESLESFRMMKSITADLMHRDASIKGFNIGYNVARAAGQTVMHAHMHIIPRRPGDVDDPVGGIRGVIASKRRY